MSGAENWRPIVGHEGAYEVSDLGRVRSLDRVISCGHWNKYAKRFVQTTRRLRGQMLRPGTKPSGHVSVALGKGNSQDVHRLVLEAFVGPCPPGQEALHENDSPADNALANLRWGTRGENLLDAVRNGRKPVGEDHHGAKLKAADIPNIRRRLAAEGPSAVARDYGVSDATIRQVRDGRSWSHAQ